MNHSFGENSLERSGFIHAESQDAIPRKQSSQEPLVFWSEDNCQKPTTSRKRSFSPLTPKENDEFSEKRKNISTTDLTKTPTGRRRTIGLRKSQFQSSSEQDDLLQKIHEASKEFLQRNIEKYKKKRDEEKAKRLSQQYAPVGTDSLFSPKTSLERDAARFTPSKRMKFFPEARQFGFSQLESPQTNESCLISTPRSSRNPKTSTPRHNRLQYLKVTPPDLSPVSAGSIARRGRSLREKSFEANKEPVKAIVEECSLSKECVPTTCTEEKIPPTEIFLINDSWDVSDESF